MIFLCTTREYWHTNLFFLSPINTPVSIKIYSSSWKKEWIYGISRHKTASCDWFLIKSRITISPITKLSCLDTFATIEIFHWHHLRETNSEHKHYLLSSRTDSSVAENIKKRKKLLKGVILKLSSNQILFCRSNLIGLNRNNIINILHRKHLGRNIFTVTIVTTIGTHIVFT